MAPREIAARAGLIVAAVFLGSLIALPLLIPHDACLSRLRPLKASPGGPTLGDGLDRLGATIEKGREELLRMLGSR